MKTINCIFISLLLFFSCRPKTTEKIVLEQWKFKTGDNKEWGNPDFDDSQWDTISAGKFWEGQGYRNYNGYAWYRIHFMLPEDLKNASYFKDSLQIFLAKVDDNDEIYLNGRLIGKNGRLTDENDTLPFEKEGAYSRIRNYILPVNSDLLHWGQMNVLAIRVQDGGGPGGIYDKIPYIMMRDVNDYLILDCNSKAGLQSIDSNVQSVAILKNNSSTYPFSGKVTITVENIDTKMQESKKVLPFSLKPNESAEFVYSLPPLNDSKLAVSISYKEKKSKAVSTIKKQLPYALTPKAGEHPRINGPKVTAARPGKPFLFRIPVTGKRPIHYNTTGLPEGLFCDENSGIISGSVKNAGEYIVKIIAKNDVGEASRALKIMIGDKLCLTPPMGWNSWNCWGLSVDETKMKTTIDAFIAKGLADHGWAYVNIDDGWESDKRLPNGLITPNEKFGDIKALADYAHERGLKLGIYSSPGPLTCGGYLGSYTYEQKDAQTYAGWGIDYLKYDWCSYGQICPDASDTNELKRPYLVMEKELRSINRDIIYSLCQYGMGDVWKWGGSAGGQLWRTTGDITDTWESMSGIGFNQEACAPYAKPGNWNDPDMLVVGYVGWGPRLHASNLTPDEQYTHISLWAMLSAPLLIGCDLALLDDFTLNLLTNDEVIEIDQDILGKQAVPVVKTEDYQIYVKELEDGSKAMGFFNLSLSEMNITASWDQIGISGKQKIRDVWRQKDLGDFNGPFFAKVPSHGVVLVKITPIQ